MARESSKKFPTFMGQDLGKGLQDMSRLFAGLAGMPTENHIDIDSFLASIYENVPRRRVANGNGFDEVEQQFYVSMFLDVISTRFESCLESFWFSEGRVIENDHNDVKYRTYTTSTEALQFYEYQDGERWVVRYKTTDLTNLGGEFKNGMSVAEIERIFDVKFERNGRELSSIHYSMGEDMDNIGMSCIVRLDDAGRVEEIEIGFSSAYPYGADDEFKYGGSSKLIVAVFVVAVGIALAAVLSMLLIVRKKRVPVFCPRCGAPIEPDAIFCSSCGNKVR